MNDSAAAASTQLAPTPSLATPHDCEIQILKAGNEVTIDLIPTTTEAEDVDDEHQTAKGDAATTAEAEDEQPPENPHHQSMYKAAREGDWAAAEMLLERDKELGWREITEAGDRALHLAVSRKHTEFVSRLIEMVGWEMLELYDGDGYTACCYAAMAGNLELVRIMMEANPFIANLQNWYGTTPFELAISYGNAHIVEYFLRVIEIKGLSEKHWFNILLVAIGSKMFDVALIILENKGNLAVMLDDDNRTALHVLAQLDIPSGDDGKRQSNVGVLAKKLWDNIQNLGTKTVVELMKNPPILHDAAKVGNLDVIEMITFDYPDLLSHVDPDGYSIFHILVTHRKRNTLELVKKARNVKNFNALSQDKHGNNLLHSAGASIRPKGLEIIAEQDVQMQRAFAWFKAVEEIVPPFYREMRNVKGYTPEEVFWKEHAKLLATSQAFMKSTAESCMLISTIVLTLVFAAAFAPPGGFDQVTGIPILLKKEWFAAFIIFQVLALFSSTMSIIGFWSIISSNYEAAQFFALPHYLRLSMCALLLSVLFVISAFLSAFFLVFVEERTAVVVSFMAPLYLLLVVGISYLLYKVWRKNKKLQNYSRMGEKINKLQ
ncbi:ankyrin repeat-containing protein At5g02620-like isoform X2 [Salvia miltiorrhiza]|uniref:ankyrin repeat-containing protein At5g02620-like isoform X2 n=1 Tax=Salvia miltiorrhiza TaxID=226208 RepID=UPI0025ABA098|nr:ankyrin repeat-containing protein At5g02620-like isoform X2 [Salvia miltiorrhiza]